MWRILLQLRVLLPYLARVLPLLERSVLGTNVLSAGGGAAMPTPDDHHREEEYEEIRASLRDLNGQLKNQTADLKYLQERLTWISKSFESETQRQAQTLEALTSLKKTVRTWAISIVVLLLVVLGAILFLMFRA
ncbi:hypothetical protein ACPOL_1357 [Acidisarcina polymorpha]|uniref:Uncharacterized protein n=2 Tax=Acidisarcina polymorpha TaxID=2211140 RepID=A0A2Z5FWD8_9BACT|nr:hypothetical protein ACPOL_1357 [Acidisarcina polymorpha]